MVSRLSRNTSLLHSFRSAGPVSAVDFKAAADLASVWECMRMQVADSDSVRLRLSGSYFEHISDLSPGAEDRVRRQFEYAAGFEADFGNSKRAQELLHMDHYPFVVEEDHINRKQHSDRVDAAAGHNPQTMTPTRPPLCFPQQADKSTQVGIRHGRFQSHEAFSGSVENVNASTVLQSARLILRTLDPALCFRASITQMLNRGADAR
jgi:hypothetical protein